VFTWSDAGGYDQTSTPAFFTDRGTSEAPAISQGGSTVVFHSSDDFMVDEPNSTTWDIFRWVAGEGLELVSRDADGGPTNGQSTAPDVSSDGSVVVFQSVASDIVAGDTNATTDVFVTVD
jgi:Tol biopolymer transport system component